MRGCKVIGDKHYLELFVGEGRREDEESKNISLGNSVSLNAAVLQLVT